MDIWQHVTNSYADTLAQEEHQPQEAVVDPTPEQTNDTGASGLEHTEDHPDTSTAPEESNFVPIIDPTLKAPEQFESGEQELEWYKTQYNSMYNTLNSKELYDKIAENYKDLLLQQEQEVEKIKETYKALQSNPKDFIRQYYPETLSELGISPVKNTDEISSEVDAKLKQEFGEDYKNMYDPNDLAPFKGDNFTRRVYDRGMEIHKQLSAENEKNKEILSTYTSKVAQGVNPVTEAQKNEYFESEFAKLSKQGVTKEEFDSFVKELESDAFQPTLELFWKLKNSDKLIAEAKQQGYEEGKKSIMQNVRKAATPVVSHTQKQSPPTNPKDYEDWTKRQLQKGMGFSINY